MHPAAARFYVRRHGRLRLDHHGGGQRLDGRDAGGIAAALSAEFPEVGCIRLEQRGRGRALRRAWTESRADVVAYMDVDLATDLAHLPRW